jgi:hypothetical protein
MTIYHHLLYHQHWHDRPLWALTFLRIIHSSSLLSIRLAFLLRLLNNLVLRCVIVFPHAQPPTWRMTIYIYTKRIIQECGECDTGLG